MDSDPGETIIREEDGMASGLTVQRRSFLSVAAMTLLHRKGLSHLDGPAPDITLEEFLKEVVPVARRLVADRSVAGQDRYLHTIAAVAAAIRVVPVPKMRASNQGKGASIGVNPGGDPFVVLHWRLEPGGFIRPHGHTYGNVVTVGLEGEALISNYEMVGERNFDHPGTFRARRTQHQVLRPGRVNLVSLEHDYIHAFRAGRDGARGLDITTRIRSKRPTPYLDASREPDNGEGTFESSWTT